MIFTPPDIISQFLMAVPMYLLLKLDYYLAMTKKRNLIAKDLRTPKYRLKIEKNKKKYTRKNQPKSTLSNLRRIDLIY